MLWNFRIWLIRRLAGKNTIIINATFHRQQGILLSSADRAYLENVEVRGDSFDLPAGAVAVNIQVGHTDDRQA